MTKWSFVIHFFLSVLLNNEWGFCHFKRVSNVERAYIDELALACALEVITPASAINNLDDVRLEDKIYIK